MNKPTQKPAQKFVPTMRLIIQCSVPVHSDEEAKTIYNELKTFLLAWSEKITLNGQVSMMLEPCCKDRKDKKNAQKPT